MDIVTLVLAKKYTNSKFKEMANFSVKIVESLPTSNIDTHTIYLVPKGSSEEENYYNEYIYVNNTWELIGSTQIDISDKMDKANPTGTGSLSINRKADTAIGTFSSAIGTGGTASQYAAHAEGMNNTASGTAAHAEGSVSTASGQAAHAEGQNTTASHMAAHSEGMMTNASGQFSHAEGQNTKATNTATHAEGLMTEANGQFSHAEGQITKANGMGSHAEGLQTIASIDAQHVEGKFNIEDTEGTYLHIAGNGTNKERGNAYTLDWDGNAWFAGKVSADGGFDISTEDIGLGNVGNFKAVSTVANQELTDIEKLNARTNIGAGTITEIKMNGTSMGTSGIVDLGEISSDNPAIQSATGNPITVNSTESQLFELKIPGITKQDKQGTPEEPQPIYGLGSNRFGKINIYEAARNHMAENDTVKGAFTILFHNNVNVSSSGTKVFCNKPYYNIKLCTIEEIMSYAMNLQSIENNTILFSYDSYETMTGIGIVKDDKIDPYYGIYGDIEDLELILEFESINPEYPILPMPVLNVNEKSFVINTPVSIYDEDYIENTNGYCRVIKNTIEIDLTTGRGEYEWVDDDIWRVPLEQFDYDDFYNDNIAEAITNKIKCTCYTPDFRIISDSDNCPNNTIAVYENYIYIKDSDRWGYYNSNKVILPLTSPKEIISDSLTQSISDIKLTNGENIISIADNINMNLSYFTNTENAHSLSLVDSKITSKYNKPKNGIPASDLADSVVFDITSKMSSEDPVGTGSFSFNRKRYTEIGHHSFAEGYDTIASEAYAHAEGYNTIASGGSCHAEGSNTVASGYNSHAEGSNTVANGSDVHTEGYNTTALNMATHAEGYSFRKATNIIPDLSTSTSNDIIIANWMGDNPFSLAKGYYSHVEGRNCLSLNQSAHAEGRATIASGENSHSEGYSTIASNYASHSSGKYNVDMTIGGAANNTTGTAFVIGNGTRDTAKSNAFSVQYDGVVKAKSTITASTTADYAEFFEWLDENPNDEDRVGHFVTLDGNKIRIATDTDDYILGVISGEPFVLGNGDCDVWNGMYLHDKFRRTMIEPAPKMIEVEDIETVTETYIDEETGEEMTREVEKVLGTHYEESEDEYEGTRFVLNPEYDPERPYISRFNRKEWSPVGMLGVLPVIHDGTAKVNGYVTVNADGIATACEKGTENSYRVIKENAEDVVEIIFK